MVAIVAALPDEAPSFQATNAAIDRAPVDPHNPSWSNSATIATMRPSMALRCPANSDNSPNNTSTRSPARTTGTSSEAVEDITPTSQPGPTKTGHPSPGQAIRCQQAQPDRRNDHRCAD